LGLVEPLERRRSDIGVEQRLALGHDVTKNHWPGVRNGRARDLDDERAHPGLGVGGRHGLEDPLVVQRPHDDEIREAGNDQTRDTARDLAHVEGREDEPRDVVEKRRAARARLGQGLSAR
jgi:hypothetical protein